MSTKQKYRKLSYGQGTLLIPIGPPAGNQSANPQWQKPFIVPDATSPAPMPSKSQSKTKLSSGEKRRRRLEARDGNLCWLCNFPLEEKGPLRKTIDHVIPVCYGGTWRLENLRLAHSLCNRIRGSQGPDNAKVLQEIRVALSAHWKLVIKSP